MAKTNLPERLAWALDRAVTAGKLKNQAELAERVGISRASVSAWFTGATKTLEGSNLTKAADALGVDAAWLATGEGVPHIAAATSASYGLTRIFSWEHEHELPEGEFVMVPRFEVHLAAGEGDEQRNLFERFQLELLHSNPLAFRADWIREKKLKPAKLASMIVRGDSMEDRLHDRDAVVIDTSQTEVIDGSIYAIWYDGGERVKRLYRRPGGGLIIHSDNEGKYPKLTLEAADCEHVRIIGRVVHVSGEGGL